MELKQDHTQIVSLELQRLTRIYEIGRELASSTDLTVVMERIMDAVQGSFRPSRAVLFLKHPASGELYTAVARSRKSKGKRLKISVSRTIVNASLKRKEAVLISDTEQLNVGAEHTIRKQGIRSALCTPLLCKNMMLGIVYLDSLDWTRSFDESDLRMLVGIAGMAAVAIMNARLIEKLQEETKLRIRLQKQLTDDTVSMAGYGVSMEESTALCLRLQTIKELIQPQHNAERVASLLTDLLGILSERIINNRGEVRVVSGSSIMAVFLSQENSNHRLSAVRAAIELKLLCSQLNEARTKKNLPLLWFGFGISTDLTIEGNLAARTSVDTQLFGLAADNAHRLAAHAGRNQIVISESTFDGVQNQVQADEKSIPPYLGDSGPPRVYVVTSVKGE